MSETFFLTGALGCIGAWVTRTVLARGDRAVVFDLGSDTRRLRDICDEDLLRGVTFVRGDITDGAAVRAAMEEHGTTQVIHLAGLQVPFCRADPAAGARVNVLGTIQVFEAAAALNLARVVYASSAAVYGPPEDEIAPDESAALEPTTHYGVFKRANEGNARVYFMERGLSSVAIRPLTVYGVGRDQGMTSGPTTAMKAAVLRRPFTISFSGRTDFNFVGDTAEAFVAAALRAPQGAKVYNLHGDSVDVQTILETIARFEPEGARGLEVKGAALPIPPALEGSALNRDLTGLPHTSLTAGIEQTLTRFRLLLKEGRLDLSDLPR